VGELEKIFFGLYRSVSWEENMVLTHREMAVLLREIERLKDCEKKLNELVQGESDDSQSG
jgi:hypothetical protein